ncbi:hypothetical protein V6N11_082778 [Hibiscus sabdariffa]|uniref:Uncharacterized protein n=1 Tax=Hibiscus sabdariffa TaxID=183260 RepID=A0ABR2QKE5_9ROSI
MEKGSEKINSLRDDSLNALSIGKREIKEERWADVAKKRLNDEVDRGVQNNVTDRALDDLRCMGFQLRGYNSEFIEPRNNNTNSSCELAVDIYLMKRTKIGDCHRIGKALWKW